MSSTSLMPEALHTDSNIDIYNTVRRTVHQKKAVHTKNTYSTNPETLVLSVSCPVELNCFDLWSILI